MILPRYYDKLDLYLKPNKALIIYGPRQVGKTTLIKQFLLKTKLKYRLDSGDNIRIQHILGSQDFDQILEYASGYNLIVLDEAQRIPNIGMGLKILIDQIPKIKIIATGSSSFELLGQVGEPLTGRKTTLTLFPISTIELCKSHTISEMKNILVDQLIFGGYPEVLKVKRSEKPTILHSIVDSYLLKDILELEKVKGSKILLDLLRLLAFQVGDEVSLTEIGNKLNIDSKTVARYIDLFEKSFVLFNLRGFSKNLRSEVTKKSKYYFYDNGIRNAIISNFNSLDLRDDVGRLWENFLVTERLKKQQYAKIYSNNYFWRTWNQQEIDWIEEKNGNINGYEFKYSDHRNRVPVEFKSAYPKAKVFLINKVNYLNFIA
ncbi:MAG: ATP-binding protein [bacterium]|nr:ATP-binding protein [bacterium]